MSFTCSATYSKKIQLYEWEHNNLSLPANDDPRYTLKNDGQTLEISQTKVEDRGDYRCVATRKGKVLGRSQNAALNVKGTCDIILLSIGKFRAFFFRSWATVHSLLCHFLRFQGACFHLFLRGAAEWSVVQSIARVLKSFYNNGVSVSEEAIESQCKCNRLELKCVTKNKSWFLSLLVVFSRHSVKESGWNSRFSWKASLLEFEIYRLFSWLWIALLFLFRWTVRWAFTFLPFPVCHKRHA